MQSSLFAKNLRQQMDAMEGESASRQARLQKQANTYAKMGLSPEEIKELLSLGSRVAPESIGVLVDDIADEHPAEMYEWDFSIQDKRGKTWSASTYGLAPVVAVNKDEAMELASRALRKILAADDCEVVVDAERTDV
jgi:hypothetical protein